MKLGVGKREVILIDREMIENRRFVDIPIAEFITDEIANCMIKHSVHVKGIEHLRGLQQELARLNMELHSRI